MARFIAFFALVSLALSLPAQTTPYVPPSVPPPPHAAASRPPIPPPASPVLDRIRAAHALNCAVSKEEEDYSRDEDHGNRAVFDLDMCKAVAVAILGPGAHFLIKPYPDENASIQALEAGDVDMVATASPLIRFRAEGVLFSKPSFYDGQGFLIKNDPSIHSPLDFADKKVCFVIETASETNLRQYADDHKISYIWFAFSEEGEMYAAFFGTNCVALTGDVSKLANVRGIARSKASDYTILTNRISEDPLAAASMSSDPRFAAVIDATLQTLINAEQLGITAANAKSMLTSSDTRIVHVLGQKFGPGTLLGLDPQWGLNVIQAVGNYGEMFERDLGSKSPLRLDRGENRLARDGGLLQPVLP